MSYTEVAQRIRTLLRLDENNEKLDGEKDNGEKSKRAAGATPSGTADASGAKPSTPYS